MNTGLYMRKRRECRVNGNFMCRWIILRKIRTRSFLRWSKSIRFSRQTEVIYAVRSKNIAIRSGWFMTILYQPFCRHLSKVAQRLLLV